VTDQGGAMGIVDSGEECGACAIARQAAKGATPADRAQGCTCNHAPPIRLQMPATVTSNTSADPW